MKKHIWVFMFSLITSIGIAQIVKKDTIFSFKNIQGIWRFKEITIKSDSTFQESFHATDLKIEEFKFEMGLSEASAFGELKSQNGELTLVFNREYYPKGFGEDKWRDLQVDYIDEKVLRLSMNNVSTYSFTNKFDGVVDIIFTYFR